MRLNMNKMRQAIVIKPTFVVLYAYAPTIIFQFVRYIHMTAIRCDAKAVGIHICNEQIFRYFFFFCLCVLSFALFCLTCILKLRRSTAWYKTWMRSRLLKPFITYFISFALRQMSHILYAICFFFLFATRSEYFKRKILSLDGNVESKTG